MDPKHCFNFLFVVPPLLCNLCTAIFALQLLLWALQKPFRNRCMIYVHLLQNQQSWISCFCIAFHCSEATGATSGLPDNQPYSFESIGTHAFALLFIASDATGATSGLPRGYLGATSGDGKSLRPGLLGLSGLPRGYLGATWQREILISGATGAIGATRGYLGAT